MREHLIFFEDKWWHFFVKPFYGLCFRKKEGARFLPFEVLLPDILEDFYVLSAENELHLVCQDKTGNILYLLYQDGVWQKSVLLESKTGASYPKHFSLLTTSGYVNLFYVILYKEKYMLIHQVLNMPDKTPAVIDRIVFGSPPYLVSKTVGTDLAIIYENEAGRFGSCTYRWSKKEFSRHLPLYPEMNPKIAGLLAEENGKIRYAAFISAGNFKNLVYFEQKEDGSYTLPVTVYLDCPQDAEPVFCRDQDKLYLLWKEHGSVMSSHSSDDGVKWSRPLRYVKNAALPPVLYTIHSGNRVFSSYGYEKEQDIVLYALPPLDTLATEKKSPAFRPKGYEAEAFARAAGGLRKEPEGPSEPLLSFIKDELFSLKEQFLSLRRELETIKSNISFTICEDGLTEDTSVIDDILLAPNQMSTDADAGIS